MKPTRRLALGSAGTLALLPAAAILLASLTACSVGDNTTSPNQQTYDDQDTQTQQADPPPVEDDGSGHGGTDQTSDGGGSGGKQTGTPSGPETVGEEG
ncbi:MAG: hypothetical protein KC729_12325 [Candidatus Eisenbacteria bacterium]|uniref:Uncharacterized protein n=1 Tax=Eiseniibacteriota bacterium TaxID=2212470 RepID=A0A956M211_UNCEI|nr:hypothetical protein [Candidatus Eisenbacteria bacterium]